MSTKSTRNFLSITAIILTLNEEINLQNCLSHLFWVDRIVVVDSGSTDSTLKVAKDFNCDIFYNPWDGFSKQRNWAIQNTGISTEWIMFIDADEEVTPRLREEICQTLISTDNNAFYLCFKVIFYGKWVKRSSSFPVWHPRLLRIGKAQFREAVTGHGETWDVIGKIGYLNEPYIHYSFSKGLHYWFEKHNNLSDMECLSKFKKKVSIYKIINYFFSCDRHKRRQALRSISYFIPFHPFLRFIYQLFIRGGILDGPSGWVYCSLYLVYEIMISSKIKEQLYISNS